MIRIGFLTLLSLVLSTLLSPSSAIDLKNYHVIQRDANGFGLFRYGTPSRSGVKALCDLGVEEVMVLNGTAATEELKYAPTECPGLKVVYNKKQNTGTPVSVSFLKAFDEWVQDARATGKKIAFRCSCGCHRTGRLAAYYQMKYQHLTGADALAIMNKHGKWMIFYPYLIPQVRALEDFIMGRPCRQNKKYCVIDA